MRIFDSIPISRKTRTSFNLSYSNKLSTGFGDLTPMYLEKIVPTDKFRNRDEFMVRFAPFFGQLFQAVKMRTEYFFVPSRLLWRTFEQFYSQGLDGQATGVHPYVNIDLVQKWFSDNSVSSIGSIIDYFNLPTDFTAVPLDPTYIDALPFYAYAKAFLDYYADENLNYMPMINWLESNPDLAVDGDNTYRVAWLLAACHVMGSNMQFSDFFTGFTANAGWPSNYASPDLVFAPLKRAYPKDYFTSALPFAQRGPIVQIPLNGTGEVRVYGDMSTNRVYNDVGIEYHPSSPGMIESGVEVTLYPRGTSAVGSSSSSFASDDSGGQTSVGGVQHVTLLEGANTAVSATTKNYNLANQNTLTFKAVNVNGTATITDLRTAIAVQSWLELKARTGGRFKETLLGNFGASSKDSRLQRTQFLQGFSSTVKIGEVFTTSQDDAGDFVPGLGVSIGQLADGSKSFKRYFDEPGYMFGNISFYPSASYYQGIPRQFLELDVMDYYWPKFQNLGEQKIENQELYMSQLGRSMTFGYTPRYSHYKTRTNQIHGDFRDSLNYMTLARKFSGQPHLNNGFVQVLPQVNDLYRCFNATGDWANAKPIYVDIYHHVKAVRPMQYYGNPRLI